MNAPRLALLGTTLTLSSLVAEPLTYPESKRTDFKETFHGVDVADPYRWLEEIDTPPVDDWVARQAAFANAYLAKLPGVKRLRNASPNCGTMRNTAFPTASPVNSSTHATQVYRISPSSIGEKTNPAPKNRSCSTRTNCLKTEPSRSVATVSVKTASTWPMARRSQALIGKSGAFVKSRLAKTPTTTSKTSSSQEPTGTKKEQVYSTVATNQAEKISKRPTSIKKSTSTSWAIPREGHPHLRAPRPSAMDAQRRLLRGWSLHHCFRLDRGRE